MHICLLFFSNKSVSLGHFVSFTECKNRLDTGLILQRAALGTTQAQQSVKRLY